MWHSSAPACLHVYFSAIQNMMGHTNKQISSSMKLCHFVIIVWILNWWLLRINRLYISNAWYYSTIAKTLISSFCLILAGDGNNGWKFSKLITHLNCTLLGTAKPQLIYFLFSLRHTSESTWVLLECLICISYPFCGPLQKWHPH